VNEPSVDALSITLTVSALAEMDTPTTKPKMMMDDLETNARVMSWSSFGDDSRDPSARTHSSGVVVSWHHRPRLARADPVYPAGGHGSSDIRGWNSLCSYPRLDHGVGGLKEQQPNVAQAAGADTPELLRLLGTGGVPAFPLSLRAKRSNPTHALVQYPREIASLRSQ
jgi:hypothetical protein